MSVATFRFYEELNDFLPPRERKRDISVSFKQRNSVKDMIESLGVPHTEIDLILANQDSVDFSYIVQGNDRISVYPVFETIPDESLMDCEDIYFEAGDHVDLVHISGEEFHTLMEGAEHAQFSSHK